MLFDLLLSQCIQAGANVLRTEVKSAIDVFKLPTVAPAAGVVNCSGLSARKIADDETLFPIKGQTITVRREASKIGVRVCGQREAWVVPHPGTGLSLLGGCKLPRDSSTDIVDEITSWILSNCKYLAPEICNKDGNFDVVSVQVGFRPARGRGPRVELEWASDHHGELKFICHNYGHSHCGYENSVGTAREAVRLVQQALAHREERNPERVG